MCALVNNESLAYLLLYRSTGSAPAADQPPQAPAKVKRVASAAPDRIVSALAIAAMALTRSLAQTYLLRMP